MSETDHLADVDNFFAVHLGLGYEIGTIIASQERPLPNARMQVRFKGEPAHAAKHPEEGRNRLQALATAIQNLYAIPRHSDGGTRINAGLVRSDNAQNTVSEGASMRLEVRGDTEALNEYMHRGATQVIAAAAEMHGVESSITPWGNRSRSSQTTR